MLFGIEIIFAKNIIILPDRYYLLAFRSIPTKKGVFMLLVDDILL